MSITYKSGGVNRQYSGSAVVIKDAAENLHFFEASSEKSISISGADTVSADAGTETYTVVGAGSLGVSFAWGVNSPFSISGGVLTIPENSDGATANITLSFDGTTVASKAVTVTAAAPATYDITIPTVTGATITVKVNGAAYTSGKLTHDDAVSIKIEAQANYNLTSSSVTMGGQPVTGSNGVYNISSVTGAVVISATAESASTEVTEEVSVTSASASYPISATLTNNFASIKSVVVSGTATSTSANSIITYAKFDLDGETWTIDPIDTENEFRTANPNIHWTGTQYRDNPTVSYNHDTKEIKVSRLSGISSSNQTRTNVAYNTTNVPTYTVKVTGVLA